MANTSILAAFERMWQHIVAEFALKTDIENYYSEESAFELALEFGLIEPVTNEIGAIFTDENNKIIII